MGRLKRGIKMEDLGKKLYEMYQSRLEQQDVGIDSWDQVDSIDQQAWRWLAEDLIDKGWMP